LLNQVGKTLSVFVEYYRIKKVLTLVFWKLPKQSFKAHYF